MSRLSAYIGATANNVAAESCREIQSEPPQNNFGNILPQQEWFGLMCREVFRFKAGAAISAVIEEADKKRPPDRTCRAWAGNESEPPGRIVALLLRSDDGPGVLEYIMRGSDAPWWIALKERCAALPPFG